MATNLKWILTHFEQMFGMRINYHKSELIPINLEDNEKQEMLDIYTWVS